MAFYLAESESLPYVPNRKLPKSAKNTNPNKAINQRSLVDLTVNLFTFIKTKA